MGAKFKSRTHLLDSFFNFWRHFLHIWLQSLKKYYYDLIKRVSKNAEFHADFKYVENLKKNAPKKVASKTSLTNMSKSGKSLHVRHVFANNFLLVQFFKTLSTDSAFLIPIMNF
jgi:hypothetical protein